jgi:hypothetical protein
MKKFYFFKEIGSSNEIQRKFKIVRHFVFESTKQVEISECIAEMVSGQVTTEDIAQKLVTMEDGRQDWRNLIRFKFSPRDELGAKWQNAVDKAFDNFVKGEYQK